MEPVVVIIVGTAAFLAGFTQGLAGFGSTLVALPVMALVLPMHAGVPLSCILAVCANAVLTSRLHVHVHSRALALLLAASLPGMALGAWLLGLVPEGALKMLLGLAILTFVWREWRSGPNLSPAGPGFGMAAGFLAGILGALIGVNGPPIVAWASRQDWSRDVLRGTITAYFLLAGIGVVTSQAVGGHVTLRVLGLAILTLPALLAGVFTGMAGCGRIGEAGFKRVLLGLLALTGASLLLQALVVAPPS